MSPKELSKHFRDVKRPGVFTHLCEVKSGDIDNSICFSFPATSSTAKIDLQAIVLRGYSIACGSLGIPLTVPQSLMITPQVTTSSFAPSLKMSHQRSLEHSKMRFL